MLTQSQKDQVMAGNEGQILVMSSNCGAEYAGQMARCSIDGAMNAIVRLEGAECAALFAFALSDRVAGGLRTTTPLVSVTPGAVGQVGAMAAESATPKDSVQVIEIGSPEQLHDMVRSWMGEEAHSYCAASVPVAAVPAATAVAPAEPKPMTNGRAIRIVSTLAIVAFSLGMLFARAVLR